MSLILEALRKMEQERRSRKGAATGIRAEVLRYRASVRQPKARPYLALGVALGLVLAGAGVGVLVNNRDNRDGSYGTHGNYGSYGGGRNSGAAAPVAPAPTVPVAAGLTPIAVPPPEPTAQTGQAGQAGQTGQAAAVRAETTPAALVPTSRAVAPKTGRSPLPAGSQAAPSKTAATRPQPQPLRREAAQDAPAVLTDITISGIAYQDERSLRRAVLNGALVGEGAEVAGARVVEIKENRVRMSRGGQVFEVPFSSGLNTR